MTQKSHNAFLIVGSLFLMLAGTGLTFFNNFNPDSMQQTLIAVMLSAAFTACEIGFIWCHKVFENVTKRWRKVVSFCAMVALILAMSFAFYQELSYALHKMKGYAQADIMTKVASGLSDKKAQRIFARSQDLPDIQLPKTLPFGICYAMAGIAYGLASVCTERKRRRIGYGQVSLTPQIESAIQKKIGFVPQDVKLYRDNRGNGVSLRSNGQYVGFISDREIQ